MVKSEKERLSNNARKQAKRIAKKLKIQEICENCQSDEELIICFRDNNVQNADVKNLYFLCKPCNEVKKFTDGRKRDDYTRCNACQKFRLCAPSLFDSHTICETCFHSYCKNNGIDEYAVLFPVKFTPNGFPETLSRIWFYGRPKFRFKTKEKTVEELAESDVFRKTVQSKIIFDMANHIHNTCTPEQIRKMYDDMKSDDEKKLFLEQLLPEDRKIFE